MEKNSKKQVSIMIYLEELLTLNDAEKGFYELYLKHPDLYKNPIKTLKHWNNHKGIFAQYKEIAKEYGGELDLFKEKFSEDIFKTDEKVIVFMHQRYFSCFVHSHEFF